MKVNRRDLIKAGVTVLGTGALAGVAGGQEESADFDRYCAFKGPTDARDLLEPEGCAYVYLDEGDSSVYISRQDEAGWSRFTGAGGGALTWDATDLNNGTDDGVVHENTTNTAYNNESLIRKGDATAAPLYASNLVAWYPLFEPSGATTAYDFSGNNNDGSYNGANVADGQELTGITTPDFDGNDDHVLISHDSTLEPSSFTVMGWVYSRGGSTNVQRFIDKGGNDHAYQVYVAPGGDVSVVVGGNFVASDQNVPTDTWVHVAGTYDGSTGDVTLYYNTQQVATGNQSSPNYAQRDLYLARRYDDSNYLNGSTCDIRLYNRVLSQSEIQEIYDVFSAESSHEFVYKGPSPSSSPTALFTSVTIPSGASATLEFLEDTNTDGTAENTDSVAMSDGVTDYTASGLAGTGDLALRVTLENTDLTVASTVEVPVEVSG